MGPLSFDHPTIPVRIAGRITPCHTGSPVSLSISRIAQYLRLISPSMGGSLFVIKIMINTRKSTATTTHWIICYYLRKFRGVS